MKAENSRVKLGTKVRVERLRHGWSQEELAERADVHPSFIGQLERGLKSASLETLKRLAAALNIGAAALIEGGAPDRAPYSPHPLERRILGLLRGRSTREHQLVYQTIRHLFRQQRKLDK